MRDTALFPVTVCSQRLQSSRKHTGTDRGDGIRGGEKEVETDRGKSDKIVFRGEGKGDPPLSRDVLQNGISYHQKT